MADRLCGRYADVKIVAREKVANFYMGGMMKYLLWASKTWQDDFKRTGKMIFLRGVNMKKTKKYVSVKVIVKREI